MLYRGTYLINVSLQLWERFIAVTAFITVYSTVNLLIQSKINQDLSNLDKGLQYLITNLIANYILLFNHKYNYYSVL